MLRRHGYAVITAQVEGMLPLWKLRNRLPPALVIRLDRWAGRQSPGLFGHQSLYLARVSN